MTDMRACMAKWGFGEVSGARVFPVVINIPGMPGVCTVMGSGLSGLVRLLERGGVVDLWHDRSSVSGVLRLITYKKRHITEQIAERTLGLWVGYLPYQSTDIMYGVWSVCCASGPSCCSAPQIQLASIVRKLGCVSFCGFAAGASAQCVNALL